MIVTQLEENLVLWVAFCTQCMGDVGMTLSELAGVVSGWLQPQLGPDLQGSPCDTIIHILENCSCSEVWRQ